MTRRILLGLLVLPMGALSGAEKTADVPIARVVLFSGGVAYLEHAGKVAGDATVRLVFQADQINDVLKSLAVSAEKGTVVGVSYASSDPLLRALKSFAVDLSGDPPLAELLKQLRGASVTVRMPGTGEVQGKVLGVEKARRQLTAGGVTTVLDDAHLRLIQDGTIRSVSLSDVTSVKLDDPKLADELDRALALLTGSADAQRKPVDVRFAGAGEREVRIGYLVAAPVWKTTYRLDLSSKPPKLQGWAIVENTSDADWSKVDLTLVTGRPISFVQDLYRPTYAPRPEIEPDPLAAEGGRKVYEDRPRKVEEKEDPRGEPLRSRYRADTLAGRLYGPKRSPDVGGIFADDSGGGGRGGLFEDESAARGRGIEAMADARKLGELFRYTVKTPVDLGRRRSAMLPIIHSPIAAEKVSIYDPAVLEAHPLNGVYLTNDTKLKLLGGPVTIFDDGAFAGEAVIETLIPEDRALLSYAVDLDVEVKHEAVGTSKTLATTVRNGRLTLMNLNGYAGSYTLNHKADGQRTVILRIPREPAWKLVEPAKPDRETTDEWWLRVALDGRGETAKAVVLQEKGFWVRDLIDLNDQEIALYLRDPQIDPDVKKVLQKLADLRKAKADRESGLGKLEAERNRLAASQQRSRENIQTLGASAEAAKRYIDRLAQDGEAYEKMEAQIRDLSKEVADQEAAIREFAKAAQAGTLPKLTPEEQNRLEEARRDGEF